MVFLSVIVLSACNPQLKNRSGIAIDESFNSDYLVNSRNSILSQDISKTPGRICQLDKDGFCQNFTPTQCLVDDTLVEVKPELNPTSMYHSLITNNYKGDVKVPFISAASSKDSLAEVRVSVSGTALIKSKDASNGFPGYAGIKSCLLHDYGAGDFGTVYWISAANIITVSSQVYTKVDGSLGVSGQGFGFGGSTYSSDQEARQKVYIGLMSHPIFIGKIEETGSSVTRSENGITKVSQPQGNPVLPPPVTPVSIPKNPDK